ncbi:hypothetical protein [Trujillonella humicola]|uniref:hypothetical protein n=1 Tax=Trujillonella humicola TaxID=3383699 RepID=UPI0039067118
MRLPSLAVAASAALLLTACGGDAGSRSPLDGLSGTEVADAAADALEEAGAVHVRGAMSQDGTEAEIDMQLQGEDAAGSLSVDGTELELVLVDGAQYLRAAAEFWAASGIPQQVAASLGGQWVVVPGGSEDFADLTLAGIADSLRNPDTPVAEEVREDELDGQDVVVVQQEDGSELFVADDDPSYPLQITDADGGSGTLTFSGFGEEQDITAPEGALDLAELGAG